jgi:hypothetical protein
VQYITRVKTYMCYINMCIVHDAHEEIDTAMPPWGEINVATACCAINRYGHMHHIHIHQ